MKKSARSAKAPAAGRGSPGPFNEAPSTASENGLPLIRQEVRKAIFHEDVPPLLQPSAESGDRLRKRRS